MPSIYVGKETIKITIEEASYGALNVLAMDLKKLIRPYNGKECFLTAAYTDLLEKLSNALTEKLLFEKD
jgi:hypothetical protein